MKETLGFFGGDASKTWKIYDLKVYSVWLKPTVARLI